MAVYAPGDSQIPEGWIRFPNGSVGPPNKVGSDWNAPYRTSSGVNPPSPSQLRGVSGGGGMGYPAAGISPPSVGGETLGTSLNTTGPEIYPPDNSTIPSNKSVGPFTGGTATENAPGGWTSNFTNGPRVDPAEMAGGGGGLGTGIVQSILSRFGLPGAIAAAGAPAVGAAFKNMPKDVPNINPATGQVDPGADDGLSSIPRGMPGRAGPAQMGMPWAGNNGGRPYGVGAPTQMGMPWADNNGGRPYGVGAPAPATRPGAINLGHGMPGNPNAVHPAVAAAAAAATQQPNSPFIGISRPNADVVNRGGRSSNSGVQGTALDLSHLFGGGQPAPAPQPAAAPRAAPRAPVRGPLAKGALPRAAAPPMAPGPIDPEIIARQRMGADYGDMTWLHGTQPPF